MRSLGFLLIFGLTGAGVLISLGVWQMQRLAWKQGVLAQIEERIAAAPAPLPADPDSERDKYLPVTATGEVGADYLRVLVSRKRIGAGYRIISPFRLPDGRNVLIDRGFLPVEAEIPPAPDGAHGVTGNLHWPEEVDGFTPEPDRAGNIWFARDVPVMAAELGTAPVLIILRARDFDDTPLEPLPVDSAGIPNDHLQYAITWFLLAAVWLVMTGFFLRRPRAGTRRQ